MPNGAKHTKGQWTSTSIGTIENDAGEIIAECVEECDRELIANAPELFETLQMLLNQADEQFNAGEQYALFTRQTFNALVRPTIKKAAL